MSGRGGISAKRKGSQFEREAAAMLGGKRTVLSGAVGGGDITLPAGSIWSGWSVEAKRRATLPKSLTKWLTQAETDIALGDPRRPALMLREDGGRAIFACYASDLITWAEALAELGQGQKVRTLVREIRRSLDEIERVAR